MQRDTCPGSLGREKMGPFPGRERTNEEKIGVVRAFEVPTLTRFAEMENYSEAKSYRQNFNVYQIFLNYYTRL